MYTAIPDLVPIWTIILALGIFLYVLLDGFDLGVGLLFGFAQDSLSRRLIINSIAPIWDGNETWLVLSSIHQHVHVERHAAFELGELEQALHQQSRIDAA